MEKETRLTAVLVTATLLAYVLSGFVLVLAFSPLIYSIGQLESQFEVGKGNEGSFANLPKPHVLGTPAGASASIAVSAVLLVLNVLKRHHMSPRWLWLILALGNMIGICMSTGGLIVARIIQKVAGA